MEHSEKKNDHRCNSPISTPKVVGSKIFRSQNNAAAAAPAAADVRFARRKQADAEIRLLCRNAPEKQKNTSSSSSSSCSSSPSASSVFSSSYLQYSLITNAAAVHDDD